MPIEEMLRIFGPGPVRVARGPGRVNLIGDHTDYNGGFVMPMAINREVRIAFRSSENSCVEMLSLQVGGAGRDKGQGDAPERVKIDLSAIDRERMPAWARYVLGVAAILQDEGHDLCGWQGVIHSNVPIGGGLSSSAALEVAAAMAFCSVSGLQINREKLARICRRAENEFVGISCGIMDQFIGLMGRKDHALFLDCSTLACEHIPFPTERAKTVVCDTGVKHDLKDSPYGDRRLECARAFKLLQRFAGEEAGKKMPETYRDISVNQFKAYAPDLSEMLRKRARHVVYENARVLHATQALQREDLITFGTLMDASHESLRMDFEVSCHELDALVASAREQKGVFGSRMTGGGFGGCVVSLVEGAHVDAFVKAISEGYEERVGRSAEIYVCDPSGGATVERIRTS